VFAGWSWDGRVLRAWNDRYGLQPLYYAERPQEVLVSPSICRLLAEGAPTELDAPALAVFLRLGWFLGERTPFSAIRALPPQADFEWQDGNLRVSGQLRFVKGQRIGRDDAIDAYIARFRAAVRRRLPSAPFVFPLSGGQDSRHILLELCEAGHPPSACCTVLEYPPDVRENAPIARRLAEVLALRHEILPQTEPRFLAETRKNVLTGFCAAEHSWVMALVDALRDRTSCVYDGLAGDVLSASHNTTPARFALYERNQLQALAEDLLGREVLPRLLTEGCRRRFSRELAVEEIVRELRRHAEAPNPVTSFIFWTRTRRMVALSPFAILATAGEVHTPYLDPEVYDLLAGLPPALTLDGGFHGDAIARAFPAVAAIPYAPNDRTSAERDAGRHYRRFGLDLLRSVAPARSRSVRTSYLLPRLGRCLLDPTYAHSVMSFGPLVLYLLELEAASRPRTFAIGSA
jgi:asparagine synthase (glutamine-hydrolysing)